MIEGVLLVLFAGILTGTFMWPMKVIRILPFEIYWFIGMFFGLFALPWLVLIIFVPDVGKLLSDVGIKTLITANILSTGWGVANVLYGICIVRIGAALAGGILTSLGVAVGVLMPMIFKGTGLFGNSPHLLSVPGILILTSIVIIMLGVIFIAKAGNGRQKIIEGIDPANKENSFSSKFISGLVIAVIAGILSSCISLSFVYSQGPVIEAAKAQGVSDFAANTSVWAIGLLGGVLVNLIYPLILIIKNRSVSKLKHSGKEVFLSVIIGIQLISGAIILGRGMVLLGALGASVGFGIQQAIQIIGNQSVGFLGGEWKNVHGKPRHHLFIGIAIFLVAIAVLALTNALAFKE